jgi:hypothetical protein
MFQTDQPTAANTLPTPATAGTQGFFTNGNPASGVAATIVDADWLNMVQQELINIITAVGLTPSKTTYNQVLQAIRTISAGYTGFVSHGTSTTLTASDIGPLIGAPAVTITLMALSTLTVGQSVTIVGTSGSGAATSIVTSGTDQIIMGATSGTAFSIPAGQSVKFTKASSAQWFAEGIAVGANIPLVVAPATASNQAVTLGQMNSAVTFKNENVYRIVSGSQQVSVNGAAFTTVGATSFTPPANGIWRVRGWGGGGGGGGSSGTGAMGGGGGGGGYFEGLLIGITTAQAVTVGTGGNGGASTPTSGGTGGTSSIGAIVSASGGSGGAAQAGAGGGAGGTGGTSAGGGFVVSGTAGGSGYGLGSGVFVLGWGGGSFGTTIQPGPATGVASTGIPGNFPGGGSTPTLASLGTNGAHGMIVIDY